MRRVAAAMLIVAACGGASRAPAPIANVAAPPRSPPAQQDAVVGWSSDDHAFIVALLAELRDSGQQDHRPQLVDFVEHVTVLVRRVDNGELTKPLLLEAFAAAEKEMTDPVAETIAEKIDDLREAMRHARAPR